MGSGQVGASRNDDLTRHYARLLLRLIFPVVITMVGVIWSVCCLSDDHLADATALPLLFEEGEHLSHSTNVRAGTMNALILVGVIAAATILIVLLYKWGCKRLLFAWLLTGVFSLLGLQMWLWLDLLCATYRIPYEALTMAFVVWNLSLVGIRSIFFEGHPYIRQGYHIVISIILGWLLCKLPQWTTWALLLLVAIYDILAVCLPYGPLRLLLQEIERRGEAVPGLIYEPRSGVAYQGDLQDRINIEEENIDETVTSGSIVDVTVGEQRSNSYSNNGSTEELSAYQRNEEVTIISSSAENSSSVSQEATAQAATSGTFEFPANSFGLGLGDFIFYSLLVGRAVRTSMISCICCMVATVVGLSCTLLGLMFLRKPLPALPISVLLGCAFYFSSRFLLEPNIQKNMSWH